MASRVEEIILRLRLKGQAATNAGLDKTTWNVTRLDRAARRTSLGIEVLSSDSLLGSRSLQDLNTNASHLTSGLTGLSAAALAVAPLLIATIGPAIALTSALGPLVGVAGAAGDGLLAAGQGAGVFALAISGVQKALKAAGDPKAYADALNSLPPAARSFTRSLVSMKPLLDNLRQNAAAGFFPGAEKGLASAARNFGPLQRVIAATAKVLGSLAAAAGRLVGSPAFGRDLETIGGRNAKVIDTLGRGALHLVSALRYVALAAGPLTQWLANTAAGWARNADGAAKAGEQSGKLAAFFERTRAILERLGSIIGHVTSGLLGIGRAGTDSGNSMWASIDRAANRFDQWANSTKGQASLKRFFQESKDLAASLIPVLAGVTQGLALLSLRLLPVTTVLGWLGPHARDATIAFVAWKLSITAITVAAKLWTAAAWLAAAASTAWSLAVATATTLSRAWTIGIRLMIIAMAQNAATWVRSTVAIVANRVATIASAIATGVMTAAQWLLNAAMDAFPVFAVIAGLAALTAGFVYAYDHSKTFRDAINWLGDAFVNVFGWVTDHWPLLLQILVGPIGLAIGLIKQNFGTVVDFIRDRINNIIDLINAPASLINKVLPGNPAPRIPKIGHRASGGPTPAGDYWVGEQGPEIVRFPTGGHVYDAGTSAAMAAGGKQGVGRTLITHVSVILDNQVVGKATATQWADDAAFA